MMKRCITIIGVLLFFVPLMATSRAMLVGVVLVRDGAKGDVWYVDPKWNTRHCLPDAAGVQAVIRSVGVLVRHTDLVKIPKAGQRIRGNAKLQKKYAGRILLDRDRKNNAWYVHPVSRMRYPLYTKSAAKKTIAETAHAVTEIALYRIPIGTDCAPALMVHVEPTPAPPSAIIGEVVPFVPPPTPLPSATPLPTLAPVVDIFCAPAAAELRAEDATCLLNERRRAGRVATLTAVDSIGRVAARYAEVIRARADYHTIAPGEPTIESLFTDAGYAYGAYSAFFGIGHKTAEQMVAAIAGSDTNTAATLLDPDYRDIGIGILLKSGDKLTVWAVLVAQSKAAREAEFVAARETAAATMFADRDAVIREIVDRTNAARSACALSECPTPLQPLTVAPLLNTAAQGHADDMKARAFYGHENPSGESVGDRATRVGYTWSTVAENIACGQETAQIVVDGWLKSPGHRHNIMNADITEIGIGFSYGRNVPCGAEQQLFTIYWAQNFGRPR